jgi:hypothetical protein
MSDEKAGVRDVESSHSSRTADEDLAHEGVRTVEATHKVFGKYSKWFLFLRYVHNTTDTLLLIIADPTSSRRNFTQFGSCCVHLLARWHDHLLVLVVRDLVFRWSHPGQHHPDRPVHYQYVVRFASPYHFVTYASYSRRWKARYCQNR